MTNEDEAKFLATLLRCVTDIDAWQKALGLLCKICGAEKALVALRDRKTADFVVPDQLADANSSPLLYGFTEQEVGAYLTKYQLLDPWTALERANHPYEPYALSQFISASDLRRSGLWEWLEPQGIDNTVVTELAYDDETFTTLNLYFSGTDEKRSRELKEKLLLHLPQLRSVWKVSREYALAMSRVTSKSWVMEHMHDPVVIIDAKNVVVACNRLAVSQMGAEVGMPLNTRGNFESIQNGRHTNVLANAPDKIAVVSEYEGGEWFTGERDHLRMVVVQDVQQAPMERDAAVWDDARLTERERAFARLVAEGNRIQDAQGRMGISKSRSMQIWKSVREKLGVKDRTELILRHKSSQDLG